MATAGSDQLILDAAVRVLEAGGSRRLTAERVAEEAGLSRVTLHRRGWKREVILGRLAERAEERYRDRMWPVLTAPGTGRERLLHALDLICVLAEENLALLLALDAEANATVFHAEGEADAQTRTVYTEPLERLLLDGAADGTLRSGDAAEDATLLFNMVGWTYIHLRSGHRWSAARASDAVITIAVEGLAGT